MPDKKEPRGNSATLRRANPVTGCPLTAALAAIGGKWKMIIIYWLAEEPTHFAGLHRKMESISRKVLTQQLRELSADGIVDRCPASRLSERVVYSLTPYGRSLLPLVETVRLWGRGHLERITRRVEEHAVPATSGRTPPYTDPLPAPDVATPDDAARPTIPPRHLVDDADPSGDHPDESRSR